jgi:hypothetical protein
MPFWETPGQFLHDRNQPPNAKQVIKEVISFSRSHRFHWPRLDSVSQALSTRTPDGLVRLYALRFEDGTTGIATVSVPNTFVDGAVREPPYAANPATACGRNWTLLAAGASSEVPTETPAYTYGHASPRVASVEIVYPNGDKTAGAVSNGYFLAWTRPGNNGATRVKLVALDKLGHEIGHLTLDRNYGGISPYRVMTFPRAGCG